MKNCNKKSHCRGWCSAHYNRWCKYGSPNIIVKKKFDNGKIRTVVSGKKKTQLIKIKGSWLSYHRFLAERFLKRNLSSTESIHHIDGNHLNNSLNNLLVIDNYNHSIIHVLEKHQNTGKKLNDTGIHLINKLPK